MLLASPFTEQLAAWSTFGGAVGSILAVVLAYLLLRREIRSRNEERRDAEAAPASLITTNVRVNPRTTFGTQVRSVACDLTNHSTAPIREVELGVWRPAEPGTAKEGTGRMYMEIRPGETKSLPLELAEPMPLPSQEEREVLADFGTGVTFTDAAGIR